MLLYNVTVGIDKEIEAEWIAWIKEKHIPDVMATGFFVDWKFYKVLHDQDDGNVSYSIQFFAETINHVTTYLEEFAPPIVAQHRTRFQNRHVTFMTLLEEV
ncbi:DUF4286 family protein [Chryseolinea lacunae]|uniref:DUF4286 family protein n=1 Tax=Chryseolinea lacunae TaxID=2801331 RepID=A0ABS1KQA5_9BACT|nr:DUF4286 family protein [Chryseolinea lacunae]MBL0741655.1 DUF4286 family protein [Chryseolinea lacunae]